jgi:hypothetical protein
VSWASRGGKGDRGTGGKGDSLICAIFPLLQNSVHSIGDTHDIFCERSERPTKSVLRKLRNNARRRMNFSVLLFPRNLNKTMWLPICLNRLH